MGQANFRIAHITFDHADYDAGSDVLYLHVGEPSGEGERGDPEGDVLRYALGSQHIAGLSVLGAQRILDNEGELRVTIPELVKTSADDLAPALAAGGRIRVTSPPRSRCSCECSSSFQANSRLYRKSAANYPSSLPHRQRNQRPYRTIGRQCR